MTNAGYQLIVGPLLVGVVINTMVFGASIMQLVTYFSSGFKDNWWILGVLMWMYAIDAFQVCSSVAMLWHYVVKDFAIPSSLSSASWEYAMLPIFSSIAPVPIQQFMAFRIMRFSESRLLFFVVSVLSISQATLACVSAAQGLTRTTPSDSVTIVPVAAAWIVIGVACDTTITVSLLYYLLKSRTGFEKTDSIVSKICSTLIKAAVPVTTTMPNNNIHYIFALPAGRLYTCTLLSTLNGRKRLRAQLEDSAKDLQRIELAPEFWRHDLQQRHEEQDVNVQNPLESESTVDLESVRDTLRTMKAEGAVTGTPDFPTFQHVLVGKLREKAYSNLSLLR
ncbi:hypothetical protein ACEPAI_4456 [Sanghuangporus weigelae]